MRVIGGRFKGTRLLPLKGLDIRPTLDRVRESLFNILGAEIEGARFLDLFAGSGAVGLEALSRGAARVVFVESQPRVRDLLARNLGKCGLSPVGEGDGDRWALRPLTAAKAIQCLEQQGEVFDWVYVDPPFDAGLYDETLTALAESRLLAGGARVIVEHFRKTVLAENYVRLKCIETRRTGDTCLSFFMRETV